MTPNRIAKMLVRRLMVSSRDQLTRYDIEALQANIERVGLVIRVRWALVAALAGFSVLGGWTYALVTPVPRLLENMFIPAIAMAFVLGYNTFYWRTYRRLGNIAILNHAQLMFDAIVVTVLVYYSGGAMSWFWAMYSLFVLEAAFILPKRWHVWAIAAFCLGANGLVIWSEYFGLLRHIEVPFISPDLYRNPTYVAVRFMWQITVLTGTASVGTLMTGALRRREEMLSRTSIVDDKTGLYDRAYLFRALTSELGRAERDGRTIAVILADIDDFDRFNRTFGIENGDQMLKAVSAAMSRAASECGDGRVRDTNFVARFGGEEFAAVITETCTGGQPSLEQAAEIAEALRVAVLDERVHDAGVTVSVGVALYPHHGISIDEVLTSADAALQGAVQAGGNTVVMAEVGE